MTKLSRYSKRTTDGKNNRTLSLSDKVVQAVDLRAERMGQSRSSLIEIVLRGQFRNEIQELDSL